MEDNNQFNPSLKEASVENITEFNNKDDNQENKNKKKKVIITLIIIIAALLIFIFGFKAAREFIENRSNKTVIENNIKPKIIKTKDVNKLTMFQASINGITINMPSNKYEFEAAGWKWNEEKAKVDVKAGYSIPGGFIGKRSVGGEVLVVNLSGKTEHVEDCTIQGIDFNYSSKKRDNVYFIGGLNFNSKENDVKDTMTKLGYKNPKINKVESSTYYRYFKEDNQNNYGDYIEFYFFKGTIKTVSIYTK